jgi:gamma-glutamyltranspeptidase / glutathione hydrolase
MFSAKKSILACVVAAIAPACHGQGLSPSTWPKAERERVEKLESQVVSPLEKRIVDGKGGLVSATLSPIAVHAGIQALKLGGTAADAAATTALTQVATQLGSVVSYAGVFTMVYYDAKSHKVYSMDAGFNSYLHESDPTSIPVSDLGPELRKFAPKPTEGGAKGRETLVPGFMAGVESMHSRFGRLPFRELFEPAVWYAEHGIRISPALSYYFTFRAKALARTPEGRQFSGQEGGATHKAGELFVQTELARTLKAVRDGGSRTMYTGQWGQDFVRIVQREGGKVTDEDMKRYKPIWSEPYKETVFGRSVYVNGPPHLGVYALFVGLNLAEALKLDQKGPYWKDPDTFEALARIDQITASAPELDKNTSSFLRGKGIDISPGAQLEKKYAGAVAPWLGRVFGPRLESDPKHSNAVVVIDKEGSIAAVTHTINSVIWGDTGIVVGGVPLPDAAGFQQITLAGIKPGDRVPHQIIDTITFEGDKPVLATGSIGVSLIPESIRVLLGVLGGHQDLATVVAAPPLLSEIDSTDVAPIASRVRASVPQGGYGAPFIATLKARGWTVTEIAAATAGGLRGTLAAVAIDSKTGKRMAVNQPGVMVFNQAE